MHDEVSDRRSPHDRDVDFSADESFDEAERIDRLLNDPKVARDLGDLGED